ncbi:hypothetical protein ES319_D11G201600v1 [Gossypium barbadense]|uniref:Uncharacterized protein n=1 Tax=Gossypium barbadense TaxID=3634 RepID=A0A5J5PE33_GOSBA|nr:hypothetical protein ES319_D11G201600v1 [Gossypium barbadense]
MSLFHVDHDDGDDELDHESIPNGAEYQRKNSGKREKRKKKKVKERETPHHSRGENPGNPVRAPLKNTKKIKFLLSLGDLPCKRTCHGKGLG